MLSRRILTAASVGTLLFVLQRAVLVDVTVFGIHPEIMLLFGICCGLAGGVNWGVAAGFAAGLLTDAFLPSSMGLAAFSFAAAGYLAGILSDDTTATPAATAMAATVSSAAGIVVFVILGKFTSSVHTSVGHVFGVTIVASIINGILAMPVRRMLRSIRFSERDLAW